LRILSQSPEAKARNAYEYAEQTYSKARSRSAPEGRSLP